MLHLVPFVTSKGGRGRRGNHHPHWVMNSCCRLHTKAMKACRISASATITSDKGRHDTWTVRYIETRQGLTVGAERDRVAGFGRLEDGLREAGEWYRWGPYVSE